MNDCAACPNNLKDVPFMDCSRCKAKYHHSCINLSIKDYNTMSKEYKTKWICVMCRSKEPKGQDNTNTPVRNNPAPSPQHEYVTQRSKARSAANCSCLSAGSVRDIIREELQAIFNSQIHPQLLEVRNAVSSFEASVAKLNEELDKIKADHATQATEIDKLKSDMESLRTLNQSLTSRVAQMDQQSRSSNIEIQCVPENKQENLINTVVQLGKIVKCPLTESHILYCSRLAKMNSSSPRPRSILVKFASPRLRDEFIAATSRFNRNNKDDKLNTGHLGIGSDKKSAVYVVENLSPDNKSLHAAARAKARQLKYKFVWVRDGRIYMRKDEQSNYVHVKSIDLLNRLS
ncbi:unnamed protein product [Euphydryas editha]|uniref:PHD-type domain-containing protein n=1 Tax=Euphydryas editha TaxID=104508 RepID=A0AAU9TP77_EUPED|nr:unnamed protein product [Euphydryas editha]